MTSTNIPNHPYKIGISTDLYFPPIDSLYRSISESGELDGTRIIPDYIEIFRGRTVDLKKAREEMIPKGIPLTYHGDTLWYTQPTFRIHPATRQEVVRANAHMDALGSGWMIHECAHKSFGGRTFGTYLPPLFSKQSAHLIRENALWLMDQMEGRQLIVEIPPFPFFLAGSMHPGEFFSHILKGTPIGLGLDIGHLLTMMEALGIKPQPENIHSWINRYLPLEHVMEVHMGGLSLFKNTEVTLHQDDHTSPIPQLLWESLEAVCRFCPMTNLKGLALEVDNKEIETIVPEFQKFYNLIQKSIIPSAPFYLSPNEASGQQESIGLDPDILELEYQDLSAYLSGQTQDMPCLIQGFPSLYKDSIYPYEIWSFGGEIEAIFPDTIRLIRLFLKDPKESFVQYFHQDLLSEIFPFDFLVVKVLKFQEWIEEILSAEIFPPEMKELVRKTSLLEGKRVLDDQALINGDDLPCLHP